jgi:iron complex outermembrane recepter protein
MLRTLRRYVIGLALLGFACRAFVPVGYMPAAITDGGPIVLCHGGPVGAWLADAGSRNGHGLFGAKLALGSRAAFVEPRVSLTINDFAFDDDSAYGDNELPAAPSYVVRGEIVYRSRNGIYGGPTLDFVGARYADFANTYEIGSYRLLGLRAGWSTDRLHVFIEARNLRDEAYVASHSVRNVAAANDAILSPGEPLSAYLGFSVQIE